MTSHDDLLAEIAALVPAEEMTRVCAQACSEIEPSAYMGALHIYRPLRELIPRSRIVLDLGCYLAPQAYYFTDHRGYVGVDQLTDFAKVGGTGEEMLRFAPTNARHYACSIQYFITEVWPTLGLEVGDVFAICSYVPDSAAVKLVKQAFDDVLIYYPSAADIAPLSGESQRTVVA